MCTDFEEDLVSFKPKSSWTLDWELHFDSHVLAEKVSEGFDLGKYTEEFSSSPIVGRTSSSDASLWNAWPCKESTGGESDNDKQLKVQDKPSTSDATSLGKSLQHSVVGQARHCLQEVATSQVPVHYRQAKRKLDSLDATEKILNKSPRTSDFPCPPRSVFALEQAPSAPFGGDITQDNLLEHLHHIPCRHQVCNLLKPTLVFHTL